MSDRFEGSVAVVTGGGAGIGRATCEALAAEGATIVVVDRDGDAARAVADRLDGDARGSAWAVEADVSRSADVGRVARRVREETDGLDVLVNNAAIRVPPGPITESSEEEWDRIIDVNLLGIVRCSRELLPLMDGGAVINVASIGAAGARPGWTAYDATKGAVVALTRDMAHDHAADGVRVNSVSPGWVITDYHLEGMEPAEAKEFYEEKTTPGGAEGVMLERAGEPMEVAAAIAFLASDEASFITGIDLPVNGGWPVL